MRSCTCDIGYTVCGSNCPSTQMRCQCRNEAGETVVGDTFDIGQLHLVTTARQWAIQG